MSESDPGGNWRFSTLEYGSIMKKFTRAIVAAAVVTLLGFAAPSSAEAGLFHKHHAAQTGCEPEPVCEPVPVCAPVCAPAPVCPKPPVLVSWCVTDPCTCCKYEVSACVPAECACEIPCLDSCRSGFLGRKILTYKWPGCDHCVEVVITKHGKTIVRG